MERIQPNATLPDPPIPSPSCLTPPPHPSLYPQIASPLSPSPFQPFPTHPLHHHPANTPHLSIQVDSPHGFTPSLTPEDDLLGLQASRLTVRPYDDEASHFLVPPDFDLPQNRSIPLPHPAPQPHCTDSFFVDPLSPPPSEQYDPFYSAHTLPTPMLQTSSTPIPDAPPTNASNDDDPVNKHNNHNDDDNNTNNTNKKQQMITNLQNTEHHHHHHNHHHRHRHSHNHHHLSNHPRLTTPANHARAKIAAARNNNQPSTTNNQPKVKQQPTLITPKPQPQSQPPSSSSPPKQQRKQSQSQHPSTTTITNTPKKPTASAIQPPATPPTQMLPLKKIKHKHSPKKPPNPRPSRHLTTSLPEPWSDIHDLSNVADLVGPVPPYVVDNLFDHAFEQAKAKAADKKLLLREELKRNAREQHGLASEISSRREAKVSRKYQLELRAAIEEALKKAIEQNALLWAFYKKFKNSNVIDGCAEDEQDGPSKKKRRVEE